MNKKSIFDRRSIFFSLMVVILFCAQTFLLIKTRGDSLRKESWAWSPRKERDLANKLKGIGLPLESAKAYERYLDAQDISPEERSTIAYTVGQLYIEAKEYEKALPWLYQVEMANPDTKLTSEVGSLIITCLERLGRHQAAEYALKARTSLDPNQQGQEGKGDKLVAQVGPEKIYLHQIDKAFDDLPPWIKKEFSTSEKKRDFAKHYIAEELIYRKGVKLGYSSDPQIRRKMEQYARQLVIQQVSRNEIEDKLTVDDADLKNYYLAHHEEYKDPNQKKERQFEEVKERVKSDYKGLKMQQAYQNLIQQSLMSTDVKLYLENVN